MTKMGKVNYLVMFEDVSFEVIIIRNGWKLKLPAGLPRIPHRLFRGS